MKPTYYCFLPTRDNERTIEQVMNSLINQTHKPAKIIVTEDGSSDKTGSILLKFEKKNPDLVKVIHTGSTTRDYRRLPKLWNMCLDKQFDYHMIGAGDCIFEKDYAEKIIAYMEADSCLVIASGDYRKKTSKHPRGAGRFVKQSWFFENYAEYFQIIGYESEILYRAIIDGYSVSVFRDAVFEHADQLGHSHNFTQFGRGMRALGYHPLYAIARCVLSLTNSDIPKKGALNMFWKYLTYRPDRSGYYSKFPKDVREKIYSYHLTIIKKRFKL